MGRTSGGGRKAGRCCGQPHPRGRKGEGKGWGATAMTLTYYGVGGFRGDWRKLRHVVNSLYVVHIVRLTDDCPQVYM